MSIPAPAHASDYLQDIGRLCRVDWPQNRRINIVCHGHSVPAGYFMTPEIRSLESYPHLLRVALAKRYPHAVINVIVTAIGGENSIQGAARFAADVLSLQPDLITLDYALNDRGHGLPAAHAAWTHMLDLARAHPVKVLLLTPTPDQASLLDDQADPLNQHASQVRALAAAHGVGLIDSLAVFKEQIRTGTPLASLMSSGNHPNLAGHSLVAGQLLAWFP